MTKFEEIVSTAQIAVCIVGKPDTSEFQLLNFPLPDTERELAEQGLSFVGVVGIVDGAPRTALAVPLDKAATSALADAFIGYLESLLNPRNTRTN